MQAPDTARVIVGWDIGGAHVKACLLRDGAVADVVQWPCPLWRGIEHLGSVLGQARQRWPGLGQARHAVTMTGEMVDLFAHREDGVLRIALHLAQALHDRVQFFAGDAGWCTIAELPHHWASVASANWLATAQHAARRLGTGVLVDIGSTTTDLIAFEGGRVLTRTRSDAARLVSGELVYQGVVRTPLCGMARRIGFRGELGSVMNELFATSADVYRLTRELDPAHDQQPTADGAGKDDAATRQRLARMIGRDAREATADDWLAFARAWRAEQLGEIRRHWEQVRSRYSLPADTLLVSAGCGDFLVPELAAVGGARCLSYGEAVARLAAPAPADLRRWVQVCAPCVAVAALFEQDEEEQH